VLAIVRTRLRLGSDRGDRFRSADESAGSPHRLDDVEE
jgi:hypothetical protein